MLVHKHDDHSLFWNGEGWGSITEAIQVDFLAGEDIEGGDFYVKERVPRPSSMPKLDDGKPNPEWNITEDGHIFKVGDRLWDYYDCRWVVVAEDPQTTHDGWFDVTNEEGLRSGTLNSVRVSKEKH